MNLTSVLRRQLLSVVIVVAMTAFIVTLPAIARITDQVSDLAGSISDLNEEEQQLLSELFSLSQRIEDSERTVATLTHEVDRVYADVDMIAHELVVVRSQYDQVCSDATSSVQFLQQMGPASYLHLLLGAENIRDFLNRTSIVFSAVRGMTSLMKDLDNHRSELVQLEADLSVRQEELKRAIAAEEQALVSLTEAVVELEAALTDLGEQREDYELKLRAIERAWLEDTRPVIASMQAAFYDLLSGDKTPPGMRLSLGLTGMRLHIPITGINELMTDVPAFYKTELYSDDDKVWLNSDAVYLTVSGNFSVNPPVELLLEIEEVLFMGMPVTDDAVDYLFPGRALTADLSAALSGMRLSDVSLHDEQIVLSVRFW